MSLRIELYERYIEEAPTDEEVESANNLKLPKPTGKVQYRRIYVRLDDIFAPKEIPGKRNHCLIEWTDGYTIVVKGSYDSICNAINDLENSNMTEDYDHLAE